MKRILAIILVAFSIFGLASCVSNKDDDNKVPNPPIDQPETPETPEEPEVPETPEEENFKLYGENFEKGIFQTATIDTTNLTSIKITIIGETIFEGKDSDIPVNFRNFKVDGEVVEYTGISGTSVVTATEFKIGNLNAIANSVNTHKYDELTNIRLHAWHKDHGRDHSIIIDVTDVDSFSFDFAVTTGAVASLENIRVDFTFKK